MKSLAFSLPTRHVHCFLALSFFLAGLTHVPAAAGDLLHFEFSDSATLALQPEPLPPAEVLRSVSASKEHPGSADFTGGALRIADFPRPEGPFSIESRYLLRKYPVEQSRFVSDIMNTATWDQGPTQGFSFRIGGAYSYPVLPRNGYGSEEEWIAAQSAYSHIDIGRLSICFGNFSIARFDSDRLWKQAYSDRCVETGVWTHMVTVWDGEEMRLYLNGQDATDPYRITGAGAEPRIDSVKDLFIGARNSGAFDVVPYDGLIDYIRIEDKALSPEEIRERFRETFAPESRDSLCWGVALPVYPRAGQVCRGRLRIETKIFNHGACTDTSFLAGFLQGDTVEIEIAKDPNFETIAATARFGQLSFDLEAAEYPELQNHFGPLYWRVRLIPAESEILEALAKRTAETPSWSPARPLVLDSAAAVSLRRPEHSGPRQRIRSDAPASLYTPIGRRLPAQRLCGERGRGGAPCLRKPVVTSEE